MYIHESATIEQNALIGKGSAVWHLVLVRGGASIGEDCVLGRGVFIDANVKIGNRVKIQNYVSVFEGVTINDGVFIGPHVTFTNDKYPRAINPDGTLKQACDWEITETYVDYGASIGANSTIVCGVTIGKWAMIGSGTVVIKDVPDYAIVIGNPGRVVGYATRQGKRVIPEFDHTLDPTKTRG